MMIILGYFLTDFLDDFFDDFDDEDDDEEDEEEDELELELELELEEDEEEEELELELSFSPLTAFLTRSASLPRFLAASVFSLSTAEVVILVLFLAPAWFWSSAKPRKSSLSSMKGSSSVWAMA